MTDAKDSGVYCNLNLEQSVCKYGNPQRDTDEVHQAAGMGQHDGADNDHHDPERKIILKGQTV